MLNVALLPAVATKSIPNAAYVANKYRLSCNNGKQIVLLNVFSS